MEIKEFIASLEKSNFSLAVENGKLILKGDRKVLSQDEINAIKINKDVINYIKENKDGLIEYVSVFSQPSSEKKPKDISSIYRLSGLQQGMLFHGLYDGKAGAYVEQLVCDLKRCDLMMFCKSWDYVMKQHSILRSAFFYDRFDVPVQCVYPEVKLPVEVLEYRTKSDVEQQAAMKEYMEADKAKGFDFKLAPLMRVALMRLSEDRYRMLWTWHHLLFDGWSMPVLMEDFLSVYELLSLGKEVKAGEEDRYEDYIRYIERRDGEKEQLYWRNYLKGVEQSTLLPFIKTTKARNRGVGEYMSSWLQLDEDKTAQIESYAQKHRITVNTVMQGVWSYLLHRYTDNRDVVYGVTVSGRPGDLAGVEKRVGMYINTLPLHSMMQEEQKVAEWLQEIQANQALSRQHQYTPLNEIQGWSAVKGDLFDTLLVFENYPVSKVISSRQWGLGIENVQMHEQTNYPLTIIVSSTNRIDIEFSYNSRLIEEFHIREIISHFQHVLQQVIDEKDRVSDIRLLTQAEEHQLLVFNDTAVEYSNNKTVIDLFAEQAKHRPEAVAVVYGAQHLTYKELDKRSSQLAHLLKSKGVKAEALVPICMNRSLEMIVGILGIWKAGGAYVPIDPGYPQDRIRYILEDTRASIVVSSKDSKLKLLTTEDVNIVELSPEWSDIGMEPVENPETAVKPNHLAYVIYTSGSTGKPKGVLIEHAGLLNLIEWHNHEYEVTELSRSTSMSGVGFDAFGWEVWPYLSAGASIYIIDDNERLSPFKLLKLFVTNNITHGFLFTAMVHEFVDSSRNKMKSLKYLLTGGDKLSSIDIEGIDYKVINNYGPTENTVVTSNYKLSAKDKDRTPPIGAPIANTNIYILNKDNRLNPTGITGEICIVGDGLARGYLNLADLTAEKFIANPFCKGATERMFKTGDLGRWLPDGNIEYLGRLDEQVKVRGYRIETGEIESVLQQSGLVRQVLVLASDENGGTRKLIGYVVVEGLLDRQAILSYLKEKLPEYMIPALWVQLDRLPLTPNGKIDKMALPDPDPVGGLSEQYVSPRTEIETKLTEIWQVLLKVEKIGIHDNFFELGGHSLLVMRMGSYIERSLSLSIPIHVLFQFTSISELSKYLEIQLNIRPNENHATEYTILNI